LKDPVSRPVRQEFGVAARGSGVDGDSLLSGKACEVMRTAGLGACAGKPVAPERLHADNSADHIAVDIDISDGEAINDGLGRVIDPRMDAERQPKVLSLNSLQDAINLARGIAHDMQAFFSSKICGAT